MKSTSSLHLAMGIICKFQIFPLEVAMSISGAQVMGMVTKIRIHSSRMRTAHSSSCLGGGGLSQCMLGYTPWGVGLETPPGVGLETPAPRVWAWRPPPSQTSQLSPFCVGLEACKACWDTTCKACWDTTPPP